MSSRLPDFPHFEHNDLDSDYQCVRDYCIEYMGAVFQQVLQMDIPAELEARSSYVREIQQKLARRERRVRNLLKFNLNTSFSDFKQMRYSRVTDERSTLGFVSGGDLKMMAPVIEMIVMISQHLAMLNQARLNRLEQVLKKMAHRSDADASDNPIAPFNLLNAFLSSIDSISFTIHEIQDVFCLIDHVLDPRLEDFYQQVEVGLMAAGHRSEYFPVDILLAPEPATTTHEPNVAADESSTVPDAIQPPAPATKKSAQTSAGEGKRTEQLKLDEANKYRLIQITEEITADLIMDDAMMRFFFDEWQRWLRHLAQTCGMESEPMRTAQDMMQRIVGLLIEAAQEAPPRAHSSNVEHYLAQAWAELGISDLNYRGILRQIDPESASPTNPVIHRYLK